MTTSKGTQQVILKAKAEFTAQLQAHFEEEHHLKVGRFEAEELYDRCLREIAPLIYNQALTDAKEFFQEHFQALSEDIVQLEINSTKVR